MLDSPRGRARLVAHVTLLAVLLASCPRAFALSPALDISQYAHTAWRIRDGFAPSRITVMAQTPDGYLWLGTESGLLRFVGVRAIPWQPPPGQALPHSWVRALCVGRDGTLWIGTLGGLASWKDGTFRRYPEPRSSVDALLEDRGGTVWVGASSGNAGGGRLCAIRGQSVQCDGEDGRFGRGVVSLHQDSAGTLWLSAETGLWRWTPGAPKLFPLSPSWAASLQGLTQADDGTLLIATRGGITQFRNGKVESFPLTASTFRALKLFRDRDGGLWIGTASGLLHVHRGRTDIFTRADGLSADYVNRFFEDREGNIWVATTDGLDRFRELAATTFSVRQGLSAAVGAVVASEDGSVWISAGGTLSRRKDGQTTIYRSLGREVESLFRDSRGRIWAATSDGIAFLENGRFVTSSVHGGVVNAIAEDTRGTVWIANRDQGLVRWSSDHDVDQTSWSTLGHNDPANRIVADRVRGGIWLGFFNGGVVYYADGKVRETFSVADGLGGGRVIDLRVEQDGTLWAATEGGLSRLKGGRVATLTSKHGLPCDRALWTVEDDSHSMWVRTDCGLARIPRSELDAWVQNADKEKDPKRTVQVTVFDVSDGIQGGLGPTGYSPSVAKSADGKLWFVDNDGLTVIDPSHLPFNHVPPQVHIERITADRQTYDVTADGDRPTRLPALTRDLEIDYTALSLVAPEKNRFRIMLEGKDDDWKDVGNRHQAFYADLPPRMYRFRVIAANNSGVWNETGAVLEFSVAPAYYQTLWFRLTLVAAAIGLLAVLYQLRLRRLAWQFNTRLEERVNERTRVARDLHDTLLQSFHAVLLRFRAATYLLPDRPEDAKRTFDSVIDEASAAVVEARNAVQGLRAASDPKTTLVDAIAALVKDLEINDSRPSRPKFIMHVEGTPGVLQPLVRDDVYRIAREALRNAFLHANATQIETDVRYDRRQFRLRIRDDGKGMDLGVLKGGRSGHFGLAGMRERAQLINATLTVWSDRGAGTEIELTIPASVAYMRH
jgi:signal transduction histidine kinase/ligand-binding sensor domain-containing protein